MHVALGARRLQGQKVVGPHLQPSAQTLDHEKAGWGLGEE